MPRIWCLETLTQMLGCFVFDQQSRSVTRISVADDGTQGDGWAGLPSISDDGRFVAFRSDTVDFDPPATNSHGSIYVFDRENHDLVTVSRA